MLIKVGLHPDSVKVLTTKEEVEVGVEALAATAARFSCESELSIATF